jgi:hypothetical protein
VIAWQIQKAMKDKKLSKNKMAALMQTSRAQLDRLLDPEQGNVTLETLHRAAHPVPSATRQPRGYARVLRLSESLQGPRPL